MYRSTLKALICAAVTVILAVGIAPAAMAENGPYATGSLALQGGSGVFTFNYTTCAGAVATNGTFIRFRNTPLRGCAVRLVDSRTGRSVELCVGTGVIPMAVQESPMVRIEPGTSVPCRP